MVGFLNAGLGKLLPERGAGRGERLRGVKRLGADLADMVDAHQAGREVFLGLAHGALRGLGRRAGLAGVGRGKQGAQCGVHGADKVVGGAHTSSLHESVKGKP